MGGILLPCQNGNNHLTIYGFKSGYEIYWVQYGKCRPQGGDQHDGGVEPMIHDILLFIGHNDGASTSMSDLVIGEMTNNENVEKVHKLMEDANA